MPSFRPLKILAAGAGALATLAGAAEWAMQQRGDAEILLEVGQARDFVRWERGEGHVVLGATIPFVHLGKQQGCVLDCTARVLPEGDRYQGLDFEVRVSNLSLPRSDGYFEAIMYKKKEHLELGLEIHVRGGADALPKLQALGSLPVEFRYAYYMRTPLHYRRAVLSYPVARAVPTAPPAPNGKSAAAPEAGGGGQAVKTRTRTVGVAIPIRTHILSPKDDFMEVVEKYALPQAKPGDVVAVAESALAIMQGRLQHVEDIQPRWLARKLCRLLDPDSSLSTPYGLEIAFQVCGTGRMLAAFGAGVLGKLAGRQGDFYRVAGPDVACIDDASGTLPPYDKYVVLGPADCQHVVDEVKRRFGLEAAVVDANDLKKCYVVALSDRSLEADVVRALIDNPQGNAGEQTPIVVIPRS